MIKKLGYSFTLAAGFMAFCSCSYLYHMESEEVQKPMQAIPANSYGTYLAGRIAHYRMDFDNAAEYYRQTAQKDSHNTVLLNKTYLMLASQGRIAEAAEYAGQMKTNGEKNEFADVILSAEAFKQSKYDESLKTSKNLHSSLYKKLFKPFIEAWSYAGLNQYNQAINALTPIKKDKSLEALYHFHAGMISDYSGKPDIAKKHYDAIIDNPNFDLAIRTLEIICNFYIRNGEKDKAVELTQKFASSVPPVNILQKINQQVIQANPKKTKLLIATPQEGLSEAMFNLASIVKNSTEVLDFSHIFIRLAIYENPNNHLARILLANILEMREMYKDAIVIYDEIPTSSPAYYIAQYKKAENLRNLNDYKGSELLLKSMILDYPDDYQLLLDLGDTLRLQEKYKEALNYYTQVLEKNPSVALNMWQIYYALGITYDRLNKWNKAEQMFSAALEIMPDNLLVLNYLGYSWLKQGKNTEKAFSYIVTAYNQAPYNSSITDSLGWAFYRLGMYDKSVAYLEKATDTEPSNAVLNEHLGDAYWQSGRKNEARFQWNHANILKDDTGEIDRKELKKKINDGMTDNQPLSFNKEEIDKIIAQITPENK